MEINSQAAFAGKMAQFIPTACFFEQVAAISDDAEIDKTVTLLSTTSLNSLPSLLYRSDPGAWSNSALYLALKRLMVSANKAEPAQYRAIWQRVICPVNPMTIERGIPGDWIMSGLSRNEAIALADDAARKGAVLAARGNPLGEQNLTMALLLYNSILDDAVTSVSFSALTDIEAHFADRDAVILKSMADASLKLAIITKNPKLLTLGLRSAALAMSVRHGGVVEGPVWATLGEAARLSDEPAQAVIFYDQAKLQGYKPQWLDVNLDAVRNQMKYEPQSVPISAENLLTNILIGGDAGDLVEGARRNVIQERKPDAIYMESGG